MAYYWKEVGVTSYDATQDMYIVSPVSHPRLQYRIPRLYICFYAEDPINYAARIKDAILRRMEAETSLQYNIFVTFMPISVEQLPKLSEPSLNSIVKNVTRNNEGLLSPNQELKLIKDVEKLNARIIAKEIHKFNRKNPHRNNIYHRTMSALLDEFHIEIPAEQARIPKANRGGTIETNGSMTNFAKSLKSIKTKFLFTQKPIMEAIGIVIEKCNRIREQSFFYFKNPPLTLADFKEAQCSHANNLLTQLHGDWYESIYRGLFDAFTRAGNWYDLRVRNYDVYECSKLSVFMSLVRFHMEACVRSVVTESIADFATFVEQSCKSTFDLPPDFVWQTPIDESPFEETTPIFLITLTLSDKGPCYTTDLDEFEETLRDIYLSPVDACHRIVRLEPRMLPQFTFPRNTYLASLGFLEDDATLPEEKLRRAVQAALIPLKAYARNYEKYVGFYTLDIDKHMHEFNKANLPAHMVKDKITDQLLHLEQLESEIPSTILIGPFEVNISGLKAELVNKCQTLCGAICTSFENRISRVMKEAMGVYEKWFTGLCETHHAVEKYMSVVNTLDTIPILVQEHDKNIRIMQQDYEVLDFFKIPLTQKNLAIKYEALIWPYRIRAKLDEFVAKVDEEMEKFKRIQAKDELLLQEKLGNVFTLFMELVEHQDINKVHEFGNEFRRAWKQLNEIDEFATLLNTRQELLKLPVTPFEQIKEHRTDFERYKNFWTTSSEFIFMVHQWTERPLAQLDISVIETSFAEMWTTIETCEAEFTNVPEMVENFATIKSVMIAFRKQQLPILKILKNPLLEKDHWEEFGAAIGLENFVITEKTSLDKFLNTTNVKPNLTVLIALNERVNAEFGHSGGELLVEEKSEAEISWRFSGQELSDVVSAGGQVGEE